MVEINFINLPGSFKPTGFTYKPVIGVGTGVAPGAPAPPIKITTIIIIIIEKIISMIISHCRGVVLFLYTWMALRQGNLRSFFTVKAGSK